MSTDHFNFRYVYALLHHDRVLSVGDFAAAMGVSPKAVSNWIHGRATPNRKRIAQMATVLGVDEKDLWTDDPAGEVSQDMYERRLRELIDGQPEHVKAKILSMVAEEIARRESSG